MKPKSRDCVCVCVICCVSLIMSSLLLTVKIFQIRGKSSPDWPERHLLLVRGTEIAAPLGAFGKMDDREKGF